MVPASCNPVVDTAIYVATLDSHGTSIEQTSSQVRPEGFSWGNPDIILPLQEFDVACDWLEQHTLIGYFVGRTAPEVMLWQCVNKS